MERFPPLVRSIPVLAQAAALVLLLWSPAIAQEPAAEAEKPTTLSADFSYVSTGGNSDAQTMAGTEKLEHRRGAWLFTQNAGAVYGTTDGVANAERYLLELRADRELSKRVAFYGLVGWTRNPFAAVDRRFDEGVGVVAHLVTPEPHQFDIEAGAGLAQRRTTAGDEENFATGRLSGKYRYAFRPKTTFELESTYLHDFEHSKDYELRSRSALVAALTNVLALKVSYIYLYRNQPPPGIKTWDSTFATGIQITY